MHMSETRNQWVRLEVSATEASAQVDFDIIAFIWQNPGKYKFNLLYISLVLWVLFKSYSFY